jgi:hypothetical protein
MALLAASMPFSWIILAAASHLATTSSFVALSAHASVTKHILIITMMVVKTMDLFIGAPPCCMGLDVQTLIRGLIKHVWASGGITPFP